MPHRHISLLPHAEITALSTFLLNYIYDSATALSQRRFYLPKAISSKSALVMGVCTPKVPPHVYSGKPRWAGHTCNRINMDFPESQWFETPLVASYFIRCTQRLFGCQFKSVLLNSKLKNYSIILNVFYMYVLYLYSPNTRGF